MRRENRHIWLGKGLIWRTSKNDVCNGDSAGALFFTSMRQKRDGGPDRVAAGDALKKISRATIVSNVYPSIFILLATSLY